MAREAWGASRFKVIATLMGATCILVSALPGTAWGTVTTRFNPLCGPNSCRNTLWAVGDGADDHVVVACSAGEVRVNGQPVNPGGGNVGCNEVGYLAVDGQDGNDIINLAGVSKAAGFDLIADPLASELDGGNGTDKIVGTGYPDRFNLYAPQSGPDTMHGGPGGDEIVGTGAADTLFGDRGADSIFAKGGDDRVDGGPGADSLDGGLGDDRMHGRDGADQIDGRNGADFLFGEKGNDSLFGRKGNDTLIGGAGFDRLYPGTGRNTFHQ
jgi:Ca2+-binding RTX toxin-like protein